MIITFWIPTSKNTKGSACLDNTSTLKPKNVKRKSLENDALKEGFLPQRAGAKKHAKLAFNSLENRFPILRQKFGMTVFGAKREGDCRGPTGPAAPPILSLASHSGEIL